MYHSILNYINSWSVLKDINRFMNYEKKNIDADIQLEVYLRLEISIQVGKIYGKYRHRDQSMSGGRLLAHECEFLFAYS